ncbi:sigma-70 family RNA polymerase sigma factor [Skermania piniformis]|uniref:Sigma-70 family RNA polymerase sigma factor n=1 Tax=Skermania pinensis TaxID=39122 RepID=A0ABX8SBF4_9ACTN|nr:sigma-70 family RNA polymerase sigma factor [Skermania piniformis]QXQ14646.1 sigma-70 family RNA polymerase sigma factor [Skermania piniformis]
MTHSNEELDAAVAAAAQGDRLALSRVLEIIRPLVVRYCRGKFGAGERGQLSADDVAQEVCLAVMTALPRYEDQGRPFMAFVYGIASHKVADAHRNVSRNKSDPTAEVPDVISTDHGPEQRALDSEASRQVSSLLSTLSDKHREILVLRLVVGLSAEETAAAVGSTAGAVRVAQHRAIAKLKTQVAKAGEMYGEGLA